MGISGPPRRSKLGLVYEAICEEKRGKDGHRLALLMAETISKKVN